MLPVSAVVTFSVMAFSAVVTFPVVVLSFSVAARALTLRCRLRRGVLSLPGLNACDYYLSM